MLVGCMDGIGFLLAAKSVFRFGELTKPSEVKITEYVMIGTLSSQYIDFINLMANDMGEASLPHPI